MQKNQAAKEAAAAKQDKDQECRAAKHAKALEEIRKMEREEEEKVAKRLE